MCCASKPKTVNRRSELQDAKYCICTKLNQWFWLSNTIKTG